MLLESSQEKFTGALRVVWLAGWAIELPQRQRQRAGFSHTPSLAMIAPKKLQDESDASTQRGKKEAMIKRHSIRWID